MPPISIFSIGSSGPGLRKPLCKIRAYKLYRQTVNELSELSDRELTDLGIARFDIARVARKAAIA